MDKVLQSRKRSIKKGKQLIPNSRISIHDLASSIPQIAHPRRYSLVESQHTQGFIHENQEEQQIQSWKTNRLPVINEKMLILQTQGELRNDYRHAKISKIPPLLHYHSQKSIENKQKIKGIDGSISTNKKKFYIQTMVIEEQKQFKKAKDKFLNKLDQKPVISHKRYERLIDLSNPKYALRSMHIPSQIIATKVKQPQKPLNKNVIQRKRQRLEQLKQKAVKRSMQMSHQTEQLQFQAWQVHQDDRNYFQFY